MFFVFRDSYVLCIYVTNIVCPFRVAISWLCNRYATKQRNQTILVSVRFVYLREELVKSHLEFTIITDRVGCGISLDTVVADVCAGVAQHSRHAADTNILLERQVAVPQVLTILGGAWLFAWLLR